MKHKVFSRIKAAAEKVAVFLLALFSTIWFVFVVTVYIVTVRSFLGFTENWPLDVANDLQLWFLALTLFAAARSEKWTRSILGNIKAHVLELCNELGVGKGAARGKPK